MITKALLITKKVKFINKKEFVVAQLSLNAKMFIIHVLGLKVKVKILVDLLGKITILAENLDYVNNFFLRFAIKVFKYSNSDYVIKLKKVNSYFKAYFIV